MCYKYIIQNGNSVVKSYFDTDNISTFGQKPSGEAKKAIGK